MVLPQDLRSLKGHREMSCSCRTAVVLQIGRDWPRMPRNERKSTRASYCRLHRMLHLFMDPSATGTEQTAYYSRCRKLSRPRPLYIHYLTTPRFLEIRPLHAGRSRLPGLPCFACSPMSRSRGRLPPSILV
ncbi:hypothetical protein IG631_07832 [Alternaria alternata]|nr:hypothetical protein IG631_07832 [Alternaria alternata]